MQEILWRFWIQNDMDWWENSNRTNPIFHGKISGFRLRFSLPKCHVHRIAMRVLAYGGLKVVDFLFRTSFFGCQGPDFVKNPSFRFHLWWSPKITHHLWLWISGKIYTNSFSCYSPVNSCLKNTIYPPKKIHKFLPFESKSFVVSPTISTTAATLASQVWLMAWHPSASTRIMAWATTKTIQHELRQPRSRRLELGGWHGDVIYFMEKAGRIEGWIRMILGINHEQYDLGTWKWGINPPMAIVVVNFHGKTFSSNHWMLADHVCDAMMIRV